MLKKGSAKKVTIYVNEDTQYHMQPLYQAILTFLMQKGVTGATASKALAGFGPHHVMHTTSTEGSWLVQVFEATPLRSTACSMTFSSRFILDSGVL